MRDWRVFFKVKKFQLVDQMVAMKYFFNKSFWQFAVADILIAFVGFFQNPYRVSKRFLVKKENELNCHQYGETPIAGWEQIFSHLQLDASDHIFELGSGRGKGAFWLASKFGCQVTAIEQIPSFVNVGNWISKITMNSRVRFVNENFITFPCESASCVYLYGICLEDAIIRILSQKLANDLKPGTKIISVSFSLADYLPEKFSLVEKFPISFPWGVGVVYVQKRN